MAWALTNQNDTVINPMASCKIWAQPHQWGSAECQPHFCQEIML